MITWVKQLTNAFGASFLWLVCLIYFTQGFRSFVWTAVSYQLKDKLNLSPAASQYVTSVAFFPWSIKPLYGILSDCIPIKGQKRIPYLIIATLLSLVPWPILGLSLTLRSSRWYLMILLTVQNIGSAMADVVIDAMIAEGVRSERASFAGDIQSISWSSMALGGIFGSLLGGYALTSFSIGTIFLFFSALPALQLLSCGWYGAKGIKRLPELTHMNGSDSVNGNDVLIDENYADKKSRASVTRRKKTTKSGKKIVNIQTRIQVPNKAKPFKFHWFYPLKAAFQSLLRAFRQPLILRPMTWFFLAHVTVPNLSTVMFYFQAEQLNMNPSFLGASRVLGSVGLMIGTFAYNRFLRTVKLRKILLITQIALSCLNLLDMLLVSRINSAYGLSDKLIILLGSALADGINQFKLMPFLILSGQLCPPGVEGTLFALFMSINNFGSTIGSFAGAALASILNISAGSYDNLLSGMFIQSLCTYIPAAFLFLIPREATGISA